MFIYIVTAIHDRRDNLKYGITAAIKCGRGLYVLIGIRIVKQRIDTFGWVEGVRL